MTTIDSEIRDRYIDVVGEQYATGTLNEAELEAALDYLLKTDDGPSDARDHLIGQYGIPLLPLLPDAEPLTIRA